MISKCVFLSGSQALVWTAVISINWRLYSESLVPPPSSRLYLVVSVHTWHWNLCCDCYSVTIMSLVTDPCNVISNGGTNRCNYVKLVDLLSQTFLRLSANLSCVHLSCSPRLQFSVSSFVLLLEECSRVVVFLPSPGRCGVLFIENFTISSRELEWILNDEHKLFLFVRKF